MHPPQNLPWTRVCSVPASTNINFSLVNNKYIRQIQEIIWSSLNTLVFLPKGREGYIARVTVPIFWMNEQMQHLLWLAADVTKNSFRQSEFKTIRNMINLASRGDTWRGLLQKFLWSCECNRLFQTWEETPLPLNQAWGKKRKDNLPCSMLRISHTWKCWMNAGTWHTIKDDK